MFKLNIVLHIAVQEVFKLKIVCTELYNRLLELKIVRTTDAYTEELLFVQSCTYVETEYCLYRHVQQTINKRLFVQSCKTNCLK